MIAVADTSPLNYLVLISQIHLLSSLYKKVVIPPAVADELQQPEASDRVRGWISTPPDWLVIQEPAFVSDPRFSDLDRGERDALALALQIGADLVLIEDRDARSVAEQCGLTIAGTLRVLATAASQSLVDLQYAFSLLQTTNFRADPKLFQILLTQEVKRRQTISRK